MHRSADGLGVGLIAVAIVAGTGWIVASRQGANDPSIAKIVQPSDWVPFSAGVIMTANSGQSTGRFYRRRDGSTAMILDTPGGRAITIHNVQTRLTYVKLGDRPWVQRPIAAAAMRPPKTEINLVRGAFAVLPERMAGLEVYELVEGGRRSRIIPSLNGFMVFHENGAGNLEEYVDLDLRAPADQLFLPSIR